MQSLSDDERREVLGGVLFDELRAIREYVQVIPSMQQKIIEIDSRLIRVEQMVQAHELDIRYLSQRIV